MDVLEEPGYSHLTVESVNALRSHLQDRIAACEDGADENEVDEKLEAFYEEDVLQKIIGKLEEIESEPDKNEPEIQLQSALLKCVKTLMNNQRMCWSARRCSSCLL